MTYTAAALILILGLSLMTRTWWAAPVFAAIVAGVVAGLVSVMGKPRPIETVWWHIDAPLIASAVREGEHIDAWVADYPTAYRLPYSKELHKQLHQAGKEAGDEGRVVFRYMDPQDGEKVFHPEPQEALPPKS